VGSRHRGGLPAEAGDAPPATNEMVKRSVVTRLLPFFHNRAGPSRIPDPKCCHAQESLAATCQAGEAGRRLLKPALLEPSVTPIVKIRAVRLVSRMATPWSQRRASRLLEALRRTGQKWNVASRGRVINNVQSVWMFGAHFWRTFYSAWLVDRLTSDKSVGETSTG
jgi:hypothetical protein